MKIAIYCNNLNQLNFFLRFVDTIESHGDQLVFWSNRLSVILKARSCGQKAVLLSGYKQSCAGSLPSEFTEWTFEKRGLLSVEKSTKRVKRYSAAAIRFFDGQKPDMLWIWNGTNRTCQVLIDVCSQYNIQTLFFEIGNFPGKLFVDTHGVNCRSWYVCYRNKLRDCDIDLQGFRDWKSHYIASKIVSHIVPQAKRISLFNYSYLEDLLGFWLCGAITDEFLDPIGKTIDFLKRRFFSLPLDEFLPEKNSGFLFFPLQVSTDSQILWNCDVSQEAALRMASSLAINEGRVLVVKLHPAEPHWSALNEVIQLRDELGFKLVGGNTFSFLQHCGRVVTINSTVGLEALLLRKPVQIIGRALYDGFDDLDIAIYLQQYLIDIDCFSSEPITAEQFKIIFERISLADLLPQRDD